MVPRVREVREGLEGLEDREDSVAIEVRRDSRLAEVFDLGEVRSHFELAWERMGSTGR